MTEFKPDAEMFVCMDETGCYQVSWNAVDHAGMMAVTKSLHEARYVRADRIDALEAEVERMTTLGQDDSWGAAYFAAEARATAAETRIADLEKALKGCCCPRPANNRPDHFTVGECVSAGECGCCDGAPLLQPAERTS